MTAGQVLTTVKRMEVIVTAKKGKSFIDRYSSKTSNSTREEV